MRASWRVFIVLVVLVATGGLWVRRALAPPPPLAAASDDFALRDVTVVNPGRERLAHATLVVQRGVIQSLAADAGNGHAADPAGSVAARLRGAYVLPGLVDMHAHLPPDNLLELSGYFLFLYLAHGVTSIRDVGDLDGTSVAAARRGIARGAFPGPRIFSCGPFVAGAEPVRWKNTIVVGVPEEAEQVASRLKAEGHVCLKSHEDLTVEKIAALKAAARRHGLQMLGHVPTRLAYEEALIPDVQHFFGVPPPASLARDHVLDRAADWQDVDDARLQQIVDVTLAHDIVNTPTLVSTRQLLLYRDYAAATRGPDARLLPRLYAEVAWSPHGGLPFWRGIAGYLDAIEGALAKKRALVLRLHRAGARLQLGSDTQQPFVVPGRSLQQEIAEFVAAGIPLEDVWAMATWKAAETLGEPGLGTLRIGAPADLLVFRDDPTRDPGALDSLEAVVAQGKLYTRADLDRVREAYLAHFRGPVVDVISVPAARLALRRSVLRDY
jgi:cytosine/adenosine deaminase-related metal-dependent hydrolase